MYRLLGAPNTLNSDYTPSLSVGVFFYIFGQHQMTSEISGCVIIDRFINTIPEGCNIKEKFANHYFSVLVVKISSVTHSTTLLG